MISLVKNKLAYIFTMIIGILFVHASVYANAYNASKVNTSHYLKIPTTMRLITMRPISDKIHTHTKTNTNIRNPKDMVVSYKKSADKKFLSQELKCLAQTIYFEAKSESYEGGIAVGNVVMNRVESPKFPKTICGVMKQKTGKMCQFSFMCNGQINMPVHAGQWKKSEKIARDVLSGKAPELSKDALFFHAKYAKLRLASNRYTAKIGQHYFYK